METKTIQVKKLERKKSNTSRNRNVEPDATVETDANIETDTTVKTDANIETVATIETDTINVPHKQQITMINRIFLEDIDFPEYSEIKSLINKKINGYKQQDIKKEREIANNIKFDDTIEKLLSCKLSCYYCSKPVFIIYDYIRQDDQWSLERINNKEPHTKENVEVACLKCNLKRRVMDNKRFAYSKKGGFGNVKKLS